jgi:hypothetical protein
MDNVNSSVETHHDLYLYLYIGVYRAGGLDSGIPAQLPSPFQPENNRRANRNRRREIDGRIEGTEKPGKVAGLSRHPKKV